MGNSHKQGSRHEYNKPLLKEKIDEAMNNFIKSGRNVQRVPTVLAPEPPSNSAPSPDKKNEPE